MMPFVGATQPRAEGENVDYKARFARWFRDLMKEKDTPNKQQLEVLYAVRDRLLEEILLENSHPWSAWHRQE